jgi:hypothetical protein
MRAITLLVSQLHTSNPPPFAAILIALVVYDYMLTLSREIDYVWFSPWNFIKVTFLVQRYLPFVDLIILSIIGAYHSHSPDPQRNYFKDMQPHHSAQSCGWQNGLLTSE